MALSYEENRLYVAECDVCGDTYASHKGSQTEMELYLKTIGFEVWKNNCVHQPKCVCFNCREEVTE